MKHTNVVVIGAGVSGLTTAVCFAEDGYCTTILASEIGQQTTSAAAAAIWFPYDAEPAELVTRWALLTFARLRQIARNPLSGVSMIELRCFARAGEIAIPTWANSLGADRLPRNEMPEVFTSGYAINVPLTDTTTYLAYLQRRLTSAGGNVQSGVHLESLERVGQGYDLIVNCAGIGARELVPDLALEPHRGQVVVISKIDLAYAIVCDDPPLMYVIPRANDCVLGGTNDVSDDRTASSTETARILQECSRALPEKTLRAQGERVGLRPFRMEGLRLEKEQLADGRSVIHNYGHGGSGFTLSWGCAQSVLLLA